MRDRLLLVGLIFVIPLLVVLSMMVLEPSSETPEIALVDSPTPTSAPTLAPTFTPFPTASPTPMPTFTSTPISIPTAAAASADVPSFAVDIQPILNARCVKCHAGDNPPRGLLLDSYAHVLKGGTYREVVIPGKPEESELIRRVRGEAIPRMPLDGPPFLTVDQIALIEAWITNGAPDN